MSRDERPPRARVGQRSDDDALTRWEADPHRTLASRPRSARPKPARGALKQAKQVKDRVFKMARSVFRSLIYRLDGGRCRRCSKHLYLKPSEAPHAFAIAHVHEFVWRSHGGDPLDRFNCLLLCAKCHDLVQTNKLEIVAVDETRLMRGPVDFPKRKAA